MSLYASIAEPPRPDDGWGLRAFKDGVLLPSCTSIHSDELNLDGWYIGITWFTSTADPTAIPNDYHRVQMRIEDHKSTDSYYAWQWGITGRLVRFNGEELEYWEDNDCE